MLQCFCLNNSEIKVSKSEKPKVAQKAENQVKSLFGWVLHSNKKSAFLFAWQQSFSFVIFEGKTSKSKNFKNRSSNCDSEPKISQSVIDSFSCKLIKISQKKTSIQDLSAPTIPFPLVVSEFLDFPMNAENCTGTSRSFEFQNLNEFERLPSAKLSSRIPVF